MHDLTFDAGEPDRASHACGACEIRHVPAWPVHCQVMHVRQPCAPATRPALPQMAAVKGLRREHAPPPRGLAPPHSRHTPRARLSAENPVHAPVPVRLRLQFSRRSLGA
jgi:hypothetical protein